MRIVKNIFLFVIIGLFIAPGVLAQSNLQSRHRDYINNRLSKRTYDKIEVIQDSRLNDLLEKHIRINKQTEGINGWRIQLYYGLSESAAIRAKTEFLRKYPDLWSKVDYSAPNFRTIVGNYSNEIDAYPFYKELLKDFKACYLIKQKIDFADLNEKNWQKFEFIDER